jgi:hypothetical protein
MTFGKFLLYLLLIGVGLLGLVASVCGAMFVTGTNGSNQQFALFVAFTGVALVVGSILGFRALLKRKDPPPPQ